MRRRTVTALLSALVGLVVVATVVPIMMLWPQPFENEYQGNASASSGEIVTARVTRVTEIPCGEIGDPSLSRVGGDSAVTESAACLEIRAQLPIGKSISLYFDELRAKTHPIYEGDTVRVIAPEFDAGDGAEAHYSFYDYPRGGKMLTIVTIFAAIVIAVGRWRGALALVGVGTAVALLTLFVLPAILAGESPIVVTVVGAVGIMLLVLYLAHGISHRTTAALFGSIFGILFTAITGAIVTRWLRFTGIASTEEASLFIAAPSLHMNDILTATIVISGLGILNDITVAQASAVWEMRALNPYLTKQRIYLSALRIGRDHIASSIYTLVFAYAGAMFVVLLLLYTNPRDLLDLVTTEMIGQEIIRTLIGAAGLVLAMPVTTMFAVLFAEDARPRVHDGPV